MLAYWAVFNHFSHSAGDTVFTMYLYLVFFSNVDRSLARLPQNAPLYVRKAGEKKVTEVVVHHHSLVLLLQSATGEDLQNKLKAMKRLSHIHMVPPPRLSMSTAPRLSMSTAPRLSMSTAPRLSMSRDPFRDCSNHWKRLYPQHTHTQTYLCFYWHNKIVQSLTSMYVFVSCM